MLLGRCLSWVTLVLLNSNEGWDLFSVLRLRITSWACLTVSGLNFIFHRLAHLFILSKSLLRLFAEVWILFTTKNKDVSPANSFALVERLLKDH